jgi:hypothetical protein
VQLDTSASQSSSNTNTSNSTGASGKRQERSAFITRFLSLSPLVPEARVRDVPSPRLSSIVPPASTVLVSGEDFDSLFIQRLTRIVYRHDLAANPDDLASTCEFTNSQD